MMVKRSAHVNLLYVINIREVFFQYIDLDVDCKGIFTTQLSINSSKIKW